MVDKKKIDELFRGVGKFIDPDDIFRKKLETSPEKIVIKFGVDPTRPDIHLGHAVVLHKLRQFQDLGCKVIFLVGDFTGSIGDPTGKSKVRPEIDNKIMVENVNTYISQIPKILKIEPITSAEKNVNIVRDSNNFVVDSPWFGWMRNNEWFQSVDDITTEGASSEALKFKIEEGNEISVPINSFIAKAVLYENTRLQKVFLKRKDIKNVSFINILSALRKISFSQLIERDMFQERIKKGEPLFMHEMLYPVIQGIDSEVISEIYGSCDLEVGGTDQIFNMLMGRKVMEMVKSDKREIQAVLAFKLLEGTDGKEKMSKSLDNYIGVTDEPSDMCGKVMSIPDSSIINYFELCTTIPMDEIEDMQKKLKEKAVNPKDLKMRLAFEIVKIYHGEKKAKEAEENFVKTFQKKEIPDEMEEIKAEVGEMLSEILVKNKVLSSKGEWRRLVLENAIHDLGNDTNITDVNLKVSENLTLKIGKKRFVKILTN